MGHCAPAFASRARWKCHFCSEHFRSVRRPTSRGIVQSLTPQPWTAMNLNERKCYENDHERRLIVRLEIEGGCDFMQYGVIR